jgi:hypothetical protein
MQDDNNYITISDTEDVIIDEDFKVLLPALDTDVFAELEKNILMYGVRDPVVLWDGVLIDGYNRFTVAKKHDLPFKAVSMEFSSRDEVLDWIIWNQIIRRNLTPMQLSHYRGVQYRARKRIISNAEGRNQHSEVKYQNDTQPKKVSTAKILAGKHNVSPITIKRNARMSEAIEAIGAVSPEAKRMILDEKVQINKSKLERLSSASPEVIAEVAAQIEAGTYERRSINTDTADTGSGVIGSGVIDTSNMSPFEAAVTRISGELFQELQKQAKAGDSKELKAALRSYIVMLEDLYESI